MAVGTGNNLQELERSWFAQKAGLADRAPVNDAKRAYFISQIGGASADIKSQNDLEKQWLKKIIDTNNPTVKYEANELPTAATPAWTKEGAFTTEEINPAGILHIISDEVSDYGLYYRHGLSFSNSVGATLEVRLKIVEADEEYDCFFQLLDGTKKHEVVITNTSVTLEGSEPYNMDTTDDFHTYRVTGQGSTSKLYIDGVLRITQTSGNMATNGVEFGNVTPTGSELLWDYIYYRTDGAFLPETQVDTNYLSSLWREAVASEGLKPSNNISENKQTFYRNVA